MGRRRKRNTKRKDVRQVHSDHRQLPAGPAGTPPAGWRRLEDRGRWELEGGGQRDRGRVGGGGEGGGQPQVLQIAAIVFINVDDANISFIKEKISNEAAKIDIEDPEKLAPGSKFVQNLFFGVSAGLSAIILFFTITLCCRARREERVQGYVEAIQA